VFYEPAYPTDPSAERVVIEKRMAGVKISFSTQGVVRRPLSSARAYRDHDHAHP
jgi:hypothetical protein